MGDLLCYVLDYAEEPHAITIAMVIKFPAGPHMTDLSIWSYDPGSEFKALAILDSFFNMMGDYVSIVRVIRIDRRR